MNNKRFFCVVLGVMIAGHSGQLFAQNMKFGPELGVNIIPLDKTDFGIDFQMGWHAGGQLSYSFKDYFALKTGVYFSQKKQLYTAQEKAPVSFFGLEDQIKDFAGDNVDLNAYTTIKGLSTQAFIDVPLLAVFRYKNFTGFAGPNFSYMIGAHTHTQTNTEIPFLKTIDINSFDPSGLLSYFLPAAEKMVLEESSSTKNLRAFDIGLKAGLGIDFNKIEFDLAYIYGFYDYQLKNARNKNQNHHYLLLSATYNFKVGTQGKDKERYQLFIK